MKTLTMHTMIAAAALVAAAGSASAQTYRAEIPVAFRVIGKQMTPGSYDVRVMNNGNGEKVYLYNRTANTSAALVSPVHSDAPRKWRDLRAPKIALECAGSDCTLRRIWNGSDVFALEFPAPKAPTGTLVTQRTEVITLTMVRAH